MQVSDLRHMSIGKRLLAFILGTGIFACGHAAWAEALTGTKSLFLLEQDGTKHPVGDITFNTSNAKTTYEISWKDDRFSDHFLSMRPFKCLEGTTKYWCRVPYPYSIKRSVSADDLTDLEYDTMFIWKGAKEYGINMWNGVYYRFGIEGDRLVGKIHELDMDKLSAPPEDGNLRPLREQDLEEGEPESHWLPGLVIE